jgi:hypothetical protein
MTDTTLRDALIDLVDRYDDTIDTSEGSSFRVSVIDPFMRRIGTGDLDTDVVTFLTDRVRAECPDLDTSALSSLQDIVIRAMSVIVEPLRRELRALRSAHSLANASSLSRAEVNALMANLLTSLVEGGYAQGIARVYYASPRSALATPATRFSTPSGVVFYPTHAQSLSSTQMSFNVDGGLYYFDIMVRASVAGSSGSVDAGEVSSVTGMPGAVRVSNPAAFSSVDDPETVDEGVARAENALTERSVATEQGLHTVISEAFPGLPVLVTVRAGDDEMQRDLVEGPVYIGGIPGGVYGLESPDLSSGVHVGGKTDIYAKVSSHTEDTLDIQALTDMGVPLYAGTSGYVLSGSLTTLRDRNVRFDDMGILAGDLVRMGSVTREVTSVSNFELSVDGDLEATGAMSYQIVRKTSGQIGVPLRHLVALSDGSPVFTDDDEPVQPLPGSTAALTSGGSPVAATENICRKTPILPIVRVRHIELLNSLTLEGTGTYIPHGVCLRAEAISDFTGGDVGPAEGTVRLWFPVATNTWFSGSTRLRTGSLTAWIPTESVTAGVSGAGQYVYVEGNWSDISKGDVIEFNDQSYLCVGSPAVISVDGGSRTLVPVRDTFDGAVSSGAATLCRGVHADDMTLDSDTDLYYADVDVTMTTVGVSGNLASGTTFERESLHVEGYRLTSAVDTLSFSVRDEPVLVLTNWFASTNLADPGQSYALRVTYDAAPTLADVQTLVDENRIVAEDPLVRHVLPTYVSYSITQTGDPDPATTIADYLDGLSNNSTLEASDLVGALHAGGATYVQLPFTLVGLYQTAERTWELVSSTDQLVVGRTGAFYAAS